MKPKVYLETTIISYLASKPSRDLITAAHQQITHDWWETRLADFEVYISQFVLDEAGAGDADAAAWRCLAVFRSWMPRQKGWNWHELWWPAVRFRPARRLTRRISPWRPFITSSSC
jgi:hypothetical protein